MTLSSSKKLKNPTLFLGNFPSKQVEEGLLEDELKKEKLQQGYILSKKPFCEITKKATILKNYIDLGDKEEIATLYGLCSKLISRKGRVKTEVFAFLEKNHILKRIPSKINFVLAIQCIRENFFVGFKALIRSTRTAPLHPDITRHQNSKGECLSHMAAICNRVDFIEYLSKTNREALIDNQGNNICHTASKYGSIETLDFLLSTSKRLFGKRNKEGKTPLQLESGEYIHKKLPLENIYADIKLGEKRKEEAFSKLLWAKKLPTSLPIIKIQQTWATEIINSKGPIFSLIKKN